MGRQINANTAPSLLIRIRDHRDQDAWSDFADTYTPLVYDFCRGRGLQPQDAADVTQEVLLRVAKAIRNFEYDPELGLFRDWLARIVHREVLRHFSSNGRTTSLPTGFDIAKQADVWNEHFQQRILDVALERCKVKFTQETWALFDKSWLRKISSAQVAAEHGVGIEKVYVARSRVLKQLRHEVSMLAENWG